MSASFRVKLSPAECLDRIGYFVATDPMMRGEWASDGLGSRVDVTRRWEEGMELHEERAGSFVVEVEPAPDGAVVTIRQSITRRLFGGQTDGERLESVIREALGVSS
jgi:hypothetical protein